MQDIHAWRRPSEATAIAATALDADALSGKFFHEKRLRPSECLVDGFREAGGVRDPRAALGAGGASDVALLVDRREDARLSELVESSSKQLRKSGDMVTKVMVVALMVSEALGRSSGDAATHEQRCEELIVERADAKRAVIRIGDLVAERRSAGHGRQPGAGGARHRAVLFKALADWLDVAPCTLHRGNIPGSKALVTWVTVAVDGGHHLVDVMFDPGALYEEGSSRAVAYLERMRQPKASSGRGGAGKSIVAAAPSTQAAAAGRMVRPPWHVEPWEVDFDRSNRAGRGGFGEVFRGKWAGQPVAVKEVRDSSPTDADICNFVLEISLLSGLSHPNIVRFWRGCVDLRSGSRTLLLVTEWMDRGVLSDFLHEAQGVTLKPGELLVLAMGVARGTAYLHEVGVLHLDLKSPNVLLNSSFQVKLCDFGLAKVRDQVGAQTTLLASSPVWAPPEMFDDQLGSISEKADVYSFGIVVFELFAQEVPFGDLSQMQMTRAKAKGQMPKFPLNLEVDIADFIRLCLAQRPGGRPAMSTVIKQVKQIARQRKVDLADEQAQMELRGFHPVGSDGSSPEQLALEADVGRLKKILQEEEKKLRLIEEQIRQKNFGSKEQDIEKFCAKHTRKVSDMKFQCALCMKLFRGEEYVHKHIKEKHFTDMLLGLAGGPATSVQPSQAKVAKLPVNVQKPDDYFDTDVAEETNARVYTNKINQEGASAQLGRSLQDAARRGELDKVQQYLRQDGGVLELSDQDGCTPLHLAAGDNHESVVAHLLSSSADVMVVNDNGLTPLHLAAQAGHVGTLQLLLDSGASLGARDSAKARMPLHLAAIGAHIEPCKVLLARRAAVNAQDTEGASALHSAARSGNRLLCELILSWGGNVNAADGEGWAPLHEAARWSEIDLVEALLLRKADVTATSNEGETPLHVVPGGTAELEVVDKLLEYKANLNAADYDGETPLHVAVKLGDDGLSAVFLDHGADANAKTKLGATPLDLAKKDEVRWLLRAHKAKRGTG